MSLAVWIRLNGVYDAPVTQLQKNERRQAITRTNAGLLSIGPPGTNFSEILIEMQKCSLIKMHLKRPSAKLVAILTRGR